ncbi:MAG TPA: nucleotide exchange factor GrpE [Caulobacteraceae bacterium]|jgi:molecular chaperone GrpE|nr:nucleotide exchange factor GrpE [Caulobacteraceae bacterium]
MSIKDQGPDDANDETGFSGPDAALDEMVQRFEAEIAQWKDHALRAAAEAENVRRRSEREMNDARAFAITRFARDVFAVADNLARALQAAPKDAVDPAVKNLALGIELTEKALHNAFEANGVKRIHPEAGEKFDPNKHQAMMEQPSAEVAPGAVISTMQAGYELFGRVIRPAMVTVAAKTAQPQPAGGAAQNPYARSADPEGEAVDTKA